MAFLKAIQFFFQMVYTTDVKVLELFPIADIISETHLHVQNVNGEIDICPVVGKPVVHNNGSSKEIHRLLVVVVCHDQVRRQVSRGFPCRGS